MKHLEGLEIQSLNINMKKVLITNPLQVGIFYLAFIVDEGHKGQYKFRFCCLNASKFRLNTLIHKESITEGPLVNHSWPL